MFADGTPVMFRSRNGSMGTIIKPNHYGGYYVRWNYGKDVKGEAMGETSSCRPEELIAIDTKLYAEYVACRGFSEEQNPIREKILNRALEGRRYL